ncbi:MAG: hypothetical protein ACREK8_11270 [Gemmatimonadales bacterium]
MTVRPETARRGASLVIVLVASVVTQSLMLVALQAAVIRVQAANDQRGRIEGQLVVASALATARLGWRSDLDTLSDGGTMSGNPVARSDGWTWRVVATRTGVLLRLVASAERRASDGELFALRRANLLLFRDSADTVRVLGRRARF